ncbi:MAG: hypothetical protein K2X28_07305 [Alphaproteobacteria bacterium]|nr:hypothetical protein [Alphaproteobacteria bacterium]
MKEVRELVLFLSLGTAVMADAPDGDEIQSLRGLPSRPEDKAIELISSPALESTTPEGDTPMRLETEASPGADQRDLDPRFMEIKVVYPEKQPSWWERTCNYLFR